MSQKVFETCVDVFGNAHTGRLCSDMRAAKPRQETRAAACSARQDATVGNDGNVGRAVGGRSQREDTVETPIRGKRQIRTSFGHQARDGKAIPCPDGEACAELSGVRQENPTILLDA